MVERSCHLQTCNPQFQLHRLDDLRFACHEQSKRSKFDRLYHHDQLVADVPIHALVDQAPVYHRPSKMPARLQQVAGQYQPVITNLNETFLQLLRQPTIASKKAIYQRYDSQVQTNTVVLPGSDAAVIRLKGTNKALAMTTDANPRYLYLNPYLGGQIALSEAARNIVAAGRAPIGITDCLNFGSPEDPEIYYELSQATKGMASACHELNIPVISGNVSLYNEYNGQAIYPTPMVGMVGLIKRLELITTQEFKQTGDLIYLVGETSDDFNGSEIQKMQQQVVNGQLGHFNLSVEQKHLKLMQQLIEHQLVQSVHDLAEGGLAVGIAESSFDNNLGVKIKVKLPQSWLFAESQSRFLISVAPEKQQAVEKMLSQDGKLIGTVTGDHLQITTNEQTLDVPVATAKKIYEEALEWQLK